MLEIKRSISILFVTALMGYSGGSYSQELSRIDPKSDGILKAATTYLSELGSFSYQGYTTFDTISSTNEKLTFDSELKATIKRPNKVLAFKTGYENFTLFYNGTTLAAVSPLSQKYALMQEVGDIDSLVKSLGRYNIEAPMSDFLTSNPYQSLTADIDSSTYVGIAEIKGVKCHHLAFRQNNVDWQLWVETGELPLIKRFKVTSKNLTGSPSYTVDIFNWKSNPQVDDALFEFTAPENGTLVEIGELKP